MNSLGPRYVILSFLLLAVHFGQCASANCTANCVEMRREWPQFDFDFYYEHSGDGPIPVESSGVISYSVHTTPVVLDNSNSSITPTASESILQPHLSPSFSTISKSPSAAIATSTLSPAITTTSLAISTSHLSEQSEEQKEQQTKSNVDHVTSPVHTPVVSIRPSEPSLPSVAFSNSTSSTKCPCDGANQTASNEQPVGNVTGPDIQTGASSKNWLENFLLRTVFRNHEQNSSSESTPINRGNLSKHFQETLQQIYQHALNRQKEHLSHQVKRRHTLSSPATVGNGTINVTIWDLQVDNSSQTIDAIYYLERDGVLLPFEDAVKVMSFASTDFIYNQTGYEVVDKVRRYSDDGRTPHNSAAATLISWFSLGWLITLLLVLSSCLLLIALLYLKHRRERRQWLESINRDINRVMPSHSTRSKEVKDRSHWNYGQDEEEEEEDEEDDEDEENEGGGGNATGGTTAAQSSDNKMDKSSQYDYGGGPYSGYSDYHQRSYPDPNVSGLPGVYHRERLIPLGTSSIDDGSSSDYDRISYVRTQETLKETKYQPNILEIQLSKETQSIVQEIRKELNRYNFKKIIAQESADQTTSDA